jgi:hypothetical protein
MDYMLENKDVVLEKIQFDDAPGSLLSDLFAAIARAETKRVGERGSAKKQSCNSL